MIYINVKTKTLIIENETVVISVDTDRFSQSTDILDGIDIRDIIIQNNKVNIDFSEKSN